MNYLEQYYSNYDEEGRLLSKHGQVEYITTMHYIHELTKGNLDTRILDIGAGTGRYSIALAEEGYNVDAVELTKHNLEIMNSKINGLENIHTYQGNAMDLSRYEDETFDLTIMLGPMYHICTEEAKLKALNEAMRVTKKGGYLCIAYILNEAAVITLGFISGRIKEYIEKGLLNEQFKFAEKPEELFVFETLDSIDRLEKGLPAKRIKLVAADGLTNYMREMIDQFDDETFELWVKYHLQTCEQSELIGRTSHCLDILQKL